MSGYLRQGTSATIRFGAMQSSTDGTAATGATLTVKLSKAGGAIAARNDATAISHDSDGYYLVTLNATDTGTVGRLRVLATATGCLPAWEHYIVLSAAVYDWLFGSAAPSTLDAAAVRVALGMAAADLDDQLDALLTTLTTDGVVLAAGAFEGVLVESDTDLREGVSIILAMVGGAIAGAGGANPTIYDRAASAARVTMTTDSSGNRSSITHTPYAG